MSITLYQRPEWSLSIIYRPHYDLAVAVLDEVIERGDAAKVKSFHGPRDLERLSDRTHRADTRAFPLIALTCIDQWREPLKHAYRRDSERLSLHGLALQSTSLSDLLARLDHVVRASSEARPVISAFREALDLEMSALMQTWEVSEPHLDTHSEESSEVSFEMMWRAQLAREPHLGDLMPPAEYSPLLRDLQRCRRELFGGDPPSLTLIHCPALKRSGRGASSPREPRGRVIAVSLDQPVSWVFCQAFHEEVHAVTDLHHGRSNSGALSRRDTRSGEIGSELHRALEENAVKRATELIKARCPQRVQDDLEWRRAYGLNAIDASVERAQGVAQGIQGAAQNTLNQLTPSRKRLVMLFIGALISAWLGALLHRALGVTITLAWAFVLSMLCYGPNLNTSGLETWLAQRRVALDVYELSNRQRFALVASIMLQALTIAMI